MKDRRQLRGLRQVSTSGVVASVQGTMERVSAFIFRGEGTFEFGVQPLPENFTAWHLYKTAKY